MIEIKTYNYSKIKSRIYLDKDQKILFGKFSGIYRPGSKGNDDGLFIFSKICSVYFLFETLSALVIDLTDLEYTWGNTILKSLNFFNEIGRDDTEKEKRVIIVTSESNFDAIDSLIKNIHKENIIVEHSSDEALLRAKFEADKYLDEG